MLLLAASPALFLAPLAPTPMRGAGLFMAADPRARPANLNPTTRAAAPPDQQQASPATRGKSWEIPPPSAPEIPPPSAPQRTFLSVADRAWASIDEPPAVMRRCARSNWREHAGAHAVRSFETSRSSLKRIFDDATAEWRALGDELLPPATLDGLERAMYETEGALDATRKSAIAAAAAVPWHEAMGGVQLARANGPPGATIDAVAGLAGKVVGLYFSASWCGPCQRLPPSLKSFYEAYQRRRPSEFEIVMVGWDEVEADRQAYARGAEMPWLAMPHEPRALTDELTLRYGVTSIPTLVMLQISPDGREAQLLTNDGREHVIRHPWSLPENNVGSVVSTQAPPPPAPPAPAPRRVWEID